MVKKISPVLTTKEACQFLRISRPTFLKLIYTNQIPAKKVGKGWKVLRSELKAFLESGENRDEETRSFDQRATILVAGDERTLASSIRDFLVDQGHKVFVAEDGRQALRAAGAKTEGRGGGGGGLLIDSGQSGADLRY